MRRFWKLLPGLVLAVLLFTPRAGAYTDVPAGTALYDEVQKAAEYGLMNGYADNTFGYVRNITRAQFAAVLGRMMGWETVSPETPHYADVSPSHYWYAAVETAYAHGVRDAVAEGSRTVFHPDWPITRYAMCKLMVQALGLESTADLYQISPAASDGGGTGSSPSGTGSAATIDVPFTDLPLDRIHAGYITVAYAVGLTYGTSDTTFTPYGTATRGQAAAMLVRMYEKMLPGGESLSAFYGFSSESQLDLAGKLDVVSAGWSRLYWDGADARLSTSPDGGNDAFLPTDYAKVIRKLSSNGADLYLEVCMDASNGVRELLSSEGSRRKAVERIVNELTVPYQDCKGNPYSGVTIRFTGYPVWQYPYFNLFLRELRSSLPKGKGLYVCLPPGEDGLCDGDVAGISQIADKVVLMAWNFDRKQMDVVPGVTGSVYLHNQPSPLPAVFRFLRTAAREAEDVSRLALGLCFQNVAWEVDSLGNQVASYPVYPSSASLRERLSQGGTASGWDEEGQVPYLYYETGKGKIYFAWYENRESVRLKRQAARLLGLDGVVVWRLGSIPDGVLPELDSAAH